jgi:hypothetical protein
VESHRRGFTHEPNNTVTAVEAEHRRRAIHADFCRRLESAYKIP